MLPKRQGPRPRFALTASPTGILTNAPGPDGCWIAFDGHPVFPVSRFSSGPSSVSWPGGVQLRLTDLGRVRISLILGDRELAATMHDFGGSREWEPPRDAHGRPLRVNKWGWFDLLLGDRTRGERADALRAARDVLAVLGGHGRSAWIAGGTALGAVRSGDFIEHDDDLDIAYLSSYEDPVDVARESFRLQRAFEARGYLCRRFSAAHIQIVGWPGSSDDPIHVDVFSAFFRGGLLHQPFHIRGPFRRDQLLPLASTTMAGVALPIPRDADAWLTLNYGPSWAQPRPDHSFRTPRGTEMRFRTWFGQYLPHFEYWQERARLDPRRTAPSESAEWLSTHVPAGTPIIELGSGDGVDAEFLAQRGFRVLALDHCHPISPASPDRRWELPPSGVRSVNADLSDSRSLLALAATARDHGSRVHVHSRNLLDELDAPTRREVLGLLGRLPPGSTLTGTVRTGERTVPAGLDPTLGLLSRRTLARDAELVGVQLMPAMIERAAPDNVMFVATRRSSMRPRRARPSAALDTLRRLPRGLHELGAEVSRWRRMPLRLAELEDIVDSQLLAPSVAEPGASTDASSTRANVVTEQPPRA